GGCRADFLEGAFYVPEKAGIVIDTVIPEVFFQSLDVVVDEAGGDLPDFEEFFDECHDPVVEADDVVVFVDYFVEDEFFQLVVRHIRARQDFRLMHRGLVGEQKLDDIPALVQEIDEIPDGEWVLHWANFKDTKSADGAVYSR